MSEPERLAYSARALAQSHPLTPLAKRFIDRAAEAERGNQSLPEVANWAAAGLTTGYCLRRVEENDAGMELTAQETDLELDELDRLSAEVMADLQAGQGAERCIGDEADVVAALDRIIASEVSRRLDNWKDRMDHEALTESEDYITWWVLKGYGLRAAEMAAGALL